MSNTVFLLMAEYGTSQIPLDKCCHIFGMQPAQAKRAASLQKLPVVAFRADSQKAPWLIHASDLAAYLDAQRDEAEALHRRLNAA